MNIFNFVRSVNDLAYWAARRKAQKAPVRPYDMSALRMHEWGIFAAVSEQELSTAKNLLCYIDAGGELVVVNDTLFNSFWQTMFERFLAVYMDCWEKASFLR